MATGPFHFEVKTNDSPEAESARQLIRSQIQAELDRRLARELARELALELGIGHGLTASEVRDAVGLEPPTEFGPSILKKALPTWQIREQLLKLTCGLVRGRFACDDLGDPKLNPPDDDDVAAPVIVEARAEK